MALHRVLAAHTATASHLNSSALNSAAAILAARLSLFRGRDLLWSQDVAVNILKTASACAAGMPAAVSVLRQELASNLAAVIGIPSG